MHKALFTGYGRKLDGSSLSRYSVSNHEATLDIQRAPSRDWFARLNTADGKTSEWKSQSLWAYERRTLAADALIASCHLAGTNAPCVPRPRRSVRWRGRQGHGESGMAQGEERLGRVGDVTGKRVIAKRPSCLPTSPDTPEYARSMADRRRTRRRRARRFRATIPALIECMSKTNF
jgi:hypothetical protein